MTRLSPKLVLLTAATVLSQPVSAAISLDQLSACDDLQSAMASVLDRHPDCQQATGRAERYIRQRLRGIPHLDICFLDPPPSRALARFQCFTVRIPQKSAELDCIKAASVSDIAEYKAHYDEIYSSRVISYLNLAAKCSVGNGDPSIAPPTVLSQFISLVANFQFGFSLPVGNRTVGDGMIVHGYGLADPDLNLGMDAIEFFSMWVKS